MRSFNRLPIRPVRALAGLIALLVPALPATAENTKTYGCTAAQVQSAYAVDCMKKLDSDVLKGYSNIHVLKCDSSGMQCCIKLGTGGWGGCEAALVAPRSNSSTVERSPRTPAPVCAELKTISGVWTPDPTSITAGTDKKSCSQTFRCAPPPSDKLSADQKFAYEVLKVDATPTFFINGERLKGAMPFEELDEKLKSLLKN